MSPSDVSRPWQSSAATTSEADGLLTQSPRRDRQWAVTPARMPLIGLLLVQLFVGYEWFVSGLTKIARGGFPTGLADELRDKSPGTVGWYAHFLSNAVIPHAKIVGYLVEYGELLAGMVFIGAALVWLFTWQRTSARGRALALLLTAGAALATTVMAINFHLANGSPHPWLIPKSGFDEGIDLDSLLPMVQLVLFAVNGWFLLELRRQSAAAMVR